MGFAFPVTLQIANAYEHCICIDSNAGGFAQKKAPIIAKGQARGSAKHVVLQMPHPSPICAGGKPFLEAHAFRQIDEACKKVGITPIDWTLH